MSLPKPDYYVSKQAIDVQMKWSLIPSPVPLICISLVHLFLVYFVGPRFMKNRQAYTLKTFIQCYNILQIFGNAWIVYNILRSGTLLTAMFRYCDTFDNITGDNAKWLHVVSWWALMIKILDLTETIVFVLRKKYNQVSLFHVYHHITTMLIVWMLIRFSYNGAILYMMTFNCGVHVIMYSYYYLSSCGPNGQRIARLFKKWLTTLQMIQLIILITPTLQGYAPYCPVSTWYTTVLVSNGFINLMCFWDFYKNSYKRLKSQ